MLTAARFAAAASLNDYQKDLQFKKLNAQKDVIEVKVLRNGDEQLVGNEELVVGDILILDTGDKVKSLNHCIPVCDLFLKSGLEFCAAQQGRRGRGADSLPQHCHVESLSGIWIWQQLTDSALVLSSCHHDCSESQPAEPVCIRSVQVVADGVFITGHGLVIDEAALTGESEPLKKNEQRPFVRSGTQVSFSAFSITETLRLGRCPASKVCDNSQSSSVQHLLTLSIQTPILRAMQVTEGDGRILVCAVGEHSEWGQTMALVVGESADTPLQEKLTVLAAAIGKVGLSVAVLCFVVLMIR